MSKKTKVNFNLSDNLQEIDEELERAMAQLDGKNESIDHLLANFDRPVFTGEAAADAEDAEEAVESVNED